MQTKRRPRRRAPWRRLGFEQFEKRTLLATGAVGDGDDSLSEAILLGSATPTAKVRDDSISDSGDVDIFRFLVTAGQSVDFDIDTVANGAGGLGSYLRIFDGQGRQLAANDNGSAPGENTVGFDAYLRFTFATAGTYFLGISNANNLSYDVLTGNGDVTTGPHATGNYRLTMQALPVDTDDATTEAIVLGSISTPVSRSGELSPDIDVDMYRIAVGANQTLDFDIDTPLNGPGGLGSYLRVFNASGVELAANDDATGPGETTLGFDSYVRVTFQTPGNYYVGVSNNTNVQYNPINGAGDIAGGLHSVGSYQLTVLPVAVTTDTDDSIGEAIDMTGGGTVSGSIAPDTDVDMYAVRVSAGQSVDFDIDTAANGPGGLGSFIRLFTINGQLLASNDDGNAPGENVVGFDSYLRFTFATAATYYLGVSNNTNIQYNPLNGTGDTGGGANATGDYQLSVRVLPTDLDDALSEARILGNVTTTPIIINGAISTDIDVNSVAIDVVAGQTIDLDIDTPLNGPGGLDSYLRLFNSQLAQFATTDSGTAPGETVVGFDPYTRFRFSSSGRFYVSVSNANNRFYDPITGNGDAAGGFNTVGSYQLIIRLVTDPPPDADDTLAEARSLGAVSTTALAASDTISVESDVDLYRFTVAAGQTVDFDIDTPQNGPGGLGSYIRLFNAQGQELAANNDAAAPGETTVGFDAYLRFTFATAGSYYLGVSNLDNRFYSPITGDGDVPASQNATGSYQLIVQGIFVDPDDTLTEAANLGSLTTTAVSRSDTINPDIDVDLYRFTVTAGQTIDLDIDTSALAPRVNSALVVFNGQGAVIAFNDNAAAPGESLGVDAYLRVTFPSAGQYYVGVSNANNTAYDPVTGNGDTAGGANAVGDYQLSVQGMIVVPADPDDSLSEAQALGAVTAAGTTIPGSISPETDVDVYLFAVAAGQAVDFDIDTQLNGSGGLNSYIRVFNAQAQQLAANNDAAAPGEGSVGFDAYLRFTFATAGNYYVAVSNSANIQYDPVTGSGDNTNAQSTTGTYQLTVRAAAVVTPALGLSIAATSIPENGGFTTGTVARQSANVTEALIVTLSASSPADLSLPPSVFIPANQTSATFSIAAVENPNQTTIRVTVTASATGFPSAQSSILVTESGPPVWQNPDIATDVDDNGFTTGFDVLLIINYLNAFPAGPLPSGSPPPYYDVTGDNAILPSDALAVINVINSQGSGEGEIASASLTPLRLSSPAVDAILAEGIDDQAISRKRQNKQRW